MPGYFTDYANNAVLNMVFGATAYDPPPTLYLGLSQSTSNKGGAIVEPSGGGYARVPIANNATSFPPAAGGTKSNNAVFTFPTPSAAWGTVQSLFVSDAATGGNILAMADLATPKLIGSGGTPATVAVGGLFLSHT
jgi:hypothetical protein